MSRKKRKRPIKYVSEQKWHEKGISTHDKTRFRQLVKKQFNPDELDHTDSANMEHATKQTIKAMANEKPEWKQLTPDKQVFTVVKYAELYSYIIKVAKDIMPNSPPRRSGMKAPEDRYALPPVQQQPMGAFQLEQTQADDQIIPEENLQVQKASPNFNFEDNSLAKPKKSLQPLFTDPALDNDTFHKEYLLRVCEADLTTVTRYRLNAHNLRVNLQQRDNLMKQKEVLQKLLLLPLELDSDDDYEQTGNLAHRQQ